jgi:hypothetical protein
MRSISEYYQKENKTLNVNVADGKWGFVLIQINKIFTELRSFICDFLSNM